MAQQETMTLKRFQQKFDSEQVCREHLFQIRWPNGFRCPKCQHESFYFWSRGSFTDVALADIKLQLQQELSCTNPIRRY